MKYIGIDPGTHCGWAVLDDEGKRIASGVWDLSSKRHEGGGMRYLRCRCYLATLFLVQALPTMATEEDFALAYEEVRGHKGTSAAQVYGGIVGVITSLCEELKVPYQGIPVGTVKKVATGKGNASKDMMIEAAIKRWTWTRNGDLPDDEADALWCAESLRRSLT